MIFHGNKKTPSYHFLGMKISKTVENAPFIERRLLMDYRYVHFSKFLYKMYDSLYKKLNSLYKMLNFMYKNWIFMYKN